MNCHSCAAWQMVTVATSRECFIIFLKVPSVTIMVQAGGRRLFSLTLAILLLLNGVPIEYSFFCLKIINPKNIHKNIQEIPDQNRISIEVTLLYFSTNQLKTQNKNILENPAQKVINKKYLGSKTYQ